MAIQNKTPIVGQQIYDFVVWQNTSQKLSAMAGQIPLWLFNTPTHIALQSALPQLTFVINDFATHTQIHGIFHVFLSYQTARSPASAPFGSFEVAEHIGYDIFGKWLTWIETYLKEHDIKNIHIKHYPECYHWSRATFVKRALLRYNFTTPQQLENQYIEIADFQFHASEKRRLRKCIEAGFKFEQPTHICPEEIYEFIAKNRRDLGYKMTFSLAMFQEWLITFPDDFLVFWVKDNDQIAALTIAVRVGATVLYNFYPTYHVAYRSFSPSVLLHQGLIDYCKKQQIKILDLGISVDESGTPKPSLVRFKRNLGAKSCQKYIFQKDI